MATEAPLSVRRTGASGTTRTPNEPRFSAGSRTSPCRRWVQTWVPSSSSRTASFSLAIDCATFLPYCVWLRSRFCCTQRSWAALFFFSCAFFLLFRLSALLGFAIGDLHDFYSKVFSVTKPLNGLLPRTLCSLAPYSWRL